MARTVRDANLETREARRRLPARHEPYWRAVESGRHFGYRKGPRGGIWKARMLREDSNYDKETLGRADDVLDADGAEIFTYAQAQAKARDWFAERARVAAGHEIASEHYAVKDAISDYLAAYAAHGKSLTETRRVANVHILPELGEIELAKLTTRRIRVWHEGLATAPARLRTRRGKPQRHRKAPADVEGRRKRRATANRVLTVLKAALNRAFDDSRVTSDEAWRKVRPFPKVDAPVIRYLNDAECVRLVNSCEPDFRPLVQAALLTGCRYGELVRLHVADYNADAGGILTVRESKGGKARHVVLTDEGRELFDALSVGKPGDALIFIRPDGKPWSKSHQQRPLSEACQRAGIKPAVSFHVLRHTHGTALAMRGVPMGVIAAQLGHADTRMTERHYAHLAPSYVADTIRASFPTLGIAGNTNVKPLSARR